MRFQHFTYLNITEKDLGHIFSTNQEMSKHWELKLNAPQYESSRRVEHIFEEIRLKEYLTSPSRKHCKFFFDLTLNPIAYANSMALFYEQYHLVEVEIIDADANIFRANKSLLTCKIDSNGQLEAEDNEIIGDARIYWSGVNQSDLDEEILFAGKFKFTGIIREAAQKYIPYLRSVNYVADEF
jgi:hypothetical protein